MKRITCVVRRLADERGITGLETAIVLIAFVVVAAVFAFVVLSTGLFSAERGKETVFAGLGKTRGSMVLTGNMLATTDTTKVTNLTFDLTLAAGGDAVNLDESATSNRTVMSYQDNLISKNSVDYTTNVITGNSDKLLEKGELFEVDVDVTAISGVTLRTNTTFSLELKPPTGSYLVIQRTTPASLARTIVNLY
jgi:archaeal flagellin FlaB